MRSIAAAIAAAAAFGLAAQQASAKDFYAGKTVTLMVPSGLGASMGIYGRIIASGLEKHIPGNPNVIVTSRPGAGGLVGTTYAYNAAPADGTFIAMISAGNVLMPMLRDGIQFDVRKMRWLGTIAVRPSVIWLWHTAPAKTIEDAEKTPIILGSNGAGGGMSLWPKMTNAVLGTKFKIIEGYKGGGAVNLAAQRGETQGRWTSYSGLTAAKSQWLEKGLVRVILQFGPRIAGQKNVPRIDDLVKGENLKLVKFMELSEHIGIGLWVRPEVPKSRLAVLRKAMMDATHDPAVIAAAAKKRAPFEPLTGEAIHKMILKAYTLTPAEEKRLREIVNVKGSKRGS
ncbi:MAG: Bug family tripartite tricarboxylate transporter substrate binding protein [Acetobacteraceae bacterium]